MSQPSVNKPSDMITQSASPFLNFNERVDMLIQHGHTLRLKLSQNRILSFRLMFIVMALLLGSALGWHLDSNSWPQQWLAGLYGTIVALMVIGIDFLIRRLPVPVVFSTAQGLGIGIVLAALCVWLLTQMFPASPPQTVSLLTFTCILIFPYFSLSIKSRVANVSNDIQPYDTAQWPLAQPIPLSPKILDTSTIIDGRILDLYETGFLEGRVLIPRFVLRELHAIADSSHSWKRTRGKRGLEVLNRLQELTNVDVQVTDEDFPYIPEVDHKLIRLAQRVQGKIVTNDWNLAKIASIQNIETLNLNQLFYQLKPPILPGDVIRVFINKEGDLPGQGVAHLDDGTMIVIDQAREYIQETIDVMITKFMQTQSGRILFASRV